MVFTLLGYASTQCPNQMASGQVSWLPGLFWQPNIWCKAASLPSCLSPAVLLCWVSLEQCSKASRYFRSAEWSIHQSIQGGLGLLLTPCLSISQAWGIPCPIAQPPCFLKTKAELKKHHLYHVRIKPVRKEWNSNGKRITIESFSWERKELHHYILYQDWILKVQLLFPQAENSVSKNGDQKKTKQTPIFLQHTSKLYFSSFSDSKCLVQSGAIWLMSTLLSLPRLIPSLKNLTG